MARTKAVLGAGARLSDYLSASLLARVYPATLIGEILDEHGCNSKRTLAAVPVKQAIHKLSAPYLSSVPATPSSPPTWAPIGKPSGRFVNRC